MGQQTEKQGSRVREDGQQSNDCEEMALLRRGEDAVRSETHVV